MPNLFHVMFETSEMLTPRTDKFKTQTDQILAHFFDIAKIYRKKKQKM